jgi:hypothetical protein
VTALAIRSDSSTVLSGAADGSVRLTNIQRSRVLGSLEGGATPNDFQLGRQCCRWCHAVLCCAVLFCTSPVLCCAVLCCAVLFSTSPVLCCTVLCCAVLFCTSPVLCCAVLCCAVLCCSLRVLCRADLSCMGDVTGMCSTCLCRDKG